MNKVTKKEFLKDLRRRLIRLPRKELHERLNFYSEIIDDKIEEGITEERAILEIGDVSDIAEQILADVPTVTASKRKSAGPWQKALLIVGAPVWLPIIISIYIVIWSVTVSIWAVEIPFYIIGFISKYLGIVCVALTKLCARITGKCTKSIFVLFR